MVPAILESGDASGKALLRAAWKHRHISAMSRRPPFGRSGRSNEQNDIGRRHQPGIGGARRRPLAPVPACRRRNGAGAAVARSAFSEIPGHRAVASGLRQLAADRRLGVGRRSRLSLSRSRRPARAEGCGAGRRLLRRLGSGGDHGALDRAVLASRSDRPARHQDRRPGGARHRRHARAAPRRIPEAGLGRSGKGRDRFHRAAGSELAAIVRGREAFALYGWKPYMHNPRLKRWLHRIDRPTLLLWGAEDGIVTPAYGEAGAGNPRGPARDHSRGRSLPPLGTARGLGRTALGLCRQSNRRSDPCVSGTSEMAYHPAWKKG